MSFVVLLDTLGYVHCLGLSCTEYEAIDVVNKWVNIHSNPEIFTKTLFSECDLVKVEYFYCFNKKSTFDITTVSIKNIQHLRCFVSQHNSNIIILEI